MPELSKRKKTAILLRCTAEEAELIRRAAALERRTLSGFILNAVMNRLRARAELAKAASPLRRKEDLP
jgi:uncharacterized protein (DUF1778 family)